MQLTVYSFIHPLHPVDFEESIGFLWEMLSFIYLTLIGGAMIEVFIELARDSDHKANRKDFWFLLCLLVSALFQIGITVLAYTLVFSTAWEKAFILLWALIAALFTFSMYVVGLCINRGSGSGISMPKFISGFLAFAGVGAIFIFLCYLLLKAL